MLRKFWLPFSFVFVIALGNIYILISSQAKIIKYNSQPPFRLDDFTKSYKVDSNSQLKNLLDKEPTTIWKKLSPGLDDKDFEIELALTHKWDGKEFVPKLPASIQIYTCTMSQLSLSIMLREAINIDKELRLPDDNIEITQEYLTEKNGAILISLEPIRKKLFTSNNYPAGISIVTLRGKYLDETGCLQGIELGENE